jgi:hypothetical protein
MSARRAEEASIEFEPINRVDGRYPYPPHPIPPELSGSRCAYGLSQLTYVAAIIIFSIVVLLATYLHKDTEAVQKLMDYLIFRSNSTQNGAS